MSEIALSAAVASTLKAADFGVSEPTNADAYAAIAASIGFTTVQTSARQQAAPAASLGRIEGAAGNVLPLRPLNVAAAQALAGQQITPDGTQGLPGEDAADVPLSIRRFAPDRYTAVMQASAMATPAGRTPAFDPWVPAQGADGFAGALTPALSERFDPASLAGTGQIATTSADPLISAANPMTSGGGTNATFVAADSALPLHHPRFGEAFSQQVTVMARDGVQHARITVNPPELGPVEMRITMRNDEATVHFAAHHVAVRDALEDAMPRLREQFEQAGLRFHDGAVFDQLPQRSPGQEYAAADPAAALPFDEIDDGMFEADGPVVVRHGLVDAYA